MVCDADVYHWFKGLSSFNRIDFLCSVMQLCLPSELRFIGTLLDDMNNKDYSNICETEEMSKNLNEFRQFSLIPFTIDYVRKLCLSLSLLKSTNQKVGQIIYEILQIQDEFANECVKSNNEFSKEILLLYSLASYHPAFTFENRYKIGGKFRKMLATYKDSLEILSNEGNQCYIMSYRKFNEINRFKIIIIDVKVNNHDADILLEILTKEDKITKRVTRFSELFNFFSQNVNFSSSNRVCAKLHLELHNLKRNGNLSLLNVYKVLGKVVGFIESINDDKCALKLFENFFLSLPELHAIPRGSLNSKIEITQQRTLEMARHSIVEGGFYLSNISKSTVTPVLNFRKTNMDTDSLNDDSTSNQCQSDVNFRNYEQTDNRINDNSSVSIFQDILPYSDTNSNITVFQYSLPTYSNFLALKSGSYPMYSNISIDCVPHSPSANSFKVVRSLIPDNFLLGPCPQNFVQLNAANPFPFVPVLCSMSQSLSTSATLLRLPSSSINQKSNIQ